MSEQSWEQRAVDEIIGEEEEEARAALRTGHCPNCWHELVEDCHDIDDDLQECVRYCYHCGWESDPYYE